MRGKRWERQERLLLFTHFHWYVSNYLYPFVPALGKSCLLAGGGGRGPYSHPGMGHSASPRRKWLTGLDDKLDPYPPFAQLRGVAPYWFMTSL